MARSAIAARFRLSAAILNRYVVIAISDTGCGIPPEIAEKVFEPFFTTKEVGRGTGQGLALARAIVLAHGGSLSFNSQDGLGTTFSVKLPIDGAVAAAA
jgi:signal transduction histidine kinase